MSRFYLILALLLIHVTSPMYGQEIDKKSSKRERPSEHPVYEYEKSPYVSADVWDCVKPYLLPSNHPVRARLDKIFSSSRVTLNQDTVLAAGFERATIRAYSHNIVSKHPDLQGYLVKFFTDEQDLQDFPPLIWRIEGANAVRNEIKARGYEKMFSVPKKWIYPLPAEPSPPPECYRKNFILVVEDMHIYRKNKNYRRWKENMTPKRADAMFVLLQVVGLYDSIYPFNLPFCEDGRQSFIDTEHHHKWPIRFDLMLPYFSPQMEHYWRIIVGQGGPR
jgi:hypothetical protein